MKLISCCSLAFLAALVLYSFTKKQEIQSFDIRNYKAKNIRSCNPDNEAVEKWLNEITIPPMPGAGIYKWKLNTTNDSAQFYFNQGINMYYGFHAIEAKASFRKAAQFDPQNPLIYWALALAYGPNINDFGYTIPPQANEAIEKAVLLLDKASALEKGLVNAQGVRFTRDSVYDMTTLNQAYADAMKKLYEQYPDHADISALYAEALMIQHPWNFWNVDKTPKPWTNGLRDVLEKSLLKAPDHPGLNHYYIHVMEGSNLAEKALPSADKLGRLTPGLSHMVHMPSHIYLRTGHFNKGSDINDKAVAQYKLYSSIFPAVTENAFLYQWHNQHMQLNSSLLAGRYAYSKKIADELQKSIDTSLLSTAPPFSNYLQYMHQTPTLVNIHFNKWSELLQSPQPSQHHIYSNILFQFGRGLALAHTNRLNEASDAQHKLQELLKDSGLALPITPFSPLKEGAQCAFNILAGTIYLKQNKENEAIQHFKAAVATDDSMMYAEPRDWMLNPKQYLGAAYLYFKKWNEAEKTFRQDMEHNNNNNVWSLYGLQQALMQQKRMKEAAIVKARYEKAALFSDHKSKLFF